MNRQESPADALHSYVKTVNDSLIEPLKKNQVKISWQRELRESKRFQETENKLTEFTDAYIRFRDNFTLPDKVLEVIKRIHATRLSQFLETGRQITPEECDELRATLAPYTELLQSVEAIKRLQNTMMSQGKLKKLPLPYEEIAATLGEVSALAAKMPHMLMDNVSYISENLEQVA